MKYRMVEFSQCEIAVRMMESLNDVQRPAGASAEEALLHVDPVVAKEYMRAAEVVFDYMVEQLDGSGFVKSHRKYKSDEGIDVH
jgi:uncharacterized protein (DUF39 family)